MACFSSKALIACLGSRDSAALHGEAKNLKTAGHIVHSKSWGMDYVVRQKLIFAAPVGRETGAALQHAP